MSQRNTLRELFDYNDWANAKVLGLCAGLPDQQLDRTHAMGLETLRRTVHHLWAAERIWLDRWKSLPKPALAEMPAGMPVAELGRRFDETARERNAFLDQAGAARLREPLAFTDIKGNPHSFPLGDLALHVVNHGTHHRAQAINMLRRAGARLPPGLDYLFFRLERPTVQQDPATVARFRAMGFSVSDSCSDPPLFEPDRIRSYYAYSDWAFSLVLRAAEGLSDAQLDQPFEMGLGTLRKTLLHVRDAEEWWLQTWTQSSGPGFPRLPETTGLAELRALAAQTSEGRMRFLDRCSGDDLQRPVTARPNEATRVSVRIGESMLQLPGHGTHHRAQAANMIRQLGGTPPALDYLRKLRESAA